MHLKSVSLSTSVFLTALQFSHSSVGAPVDLSNWTADNMGSSNWVIQSSPQNSSVLQTVNGNPTIFYDPGSSTLGTSLSGSIEVTTRSDDDFIGFVLGYDAGELGSSNTDFMLLNWKQRSQNLSACKGFGPVGLSISRVTDSSTACSYWTHPAGSINELKRAATLGSTGWQDHTSYNFEINFTASLIEVLIDDVLEISLTAEEAGVSAFDDGSYGLYNYSQRNVLFSSIELNHITMEEDPMTAEESASTPTAVSEPGSLALLSAGLMGFLFRRNNQT